LAAKLKIHPAIIAGRIRYEQNNYKFESTLPKALWKGRYERGVRAPTDFENRDRYLRTFEDLLYDSVYTLIP